MIHRVPFCDRQLRKFALGKRRKHDLCYILPYEDSLQAAATKECQSLDSRHTIRDDGALERSAVLKRPLPDLRHALRDDDAPERRTTLERLLLDLRKVCGKFDLPQRGTAVKGAPADGREALRQGDPLQRAAKGEQPRLDRLQPRRQGDLLQGGAAVERRPPDGGQPGGERDAFQPAAIAERPYTDLRHALRNDELDQSRALVEGAVPDGSEPLRELDMLQPRGEIKRILCDLRHAAVGGDDALLATDAQHLALRLDDAVARAVKDGIARRDRQRRERGAAAEGGLPELRHVPPERDALEIFTHREHGIPDRHDPRGDEERPRGGVFIADHIVDRRDRLPVVFPRDDDVGGERSARRDVGDRIAAVLRFAEGKTGGIRRLEGFAAERAEARRDVVPARGDGDRLLYAASRADALLLPRFRAGRGGQDPDLKVMPARGENARLLRAASRADALLLPRFRAGRGDDRLPRAEGVFVRPVRILRTGGKADHTGKREQAGDGCK